MMDYYIIYSCATKTYCTLSTHTGNDISQYLGEVARRTNTPMNDMRMYRFKTKKSWLEFIQENRKSFIDIWNL